MGTVSKYSDRAAHMQSQFPSLPLLFLASSDPKHFFFLFGIARRGEEAWLPGLRWSSSLDSWAFGGSSEPPNPSFDTTLELVLAVLALIQGVANVAQDFGGRSASQAVCKESRGSWTFGSLAGPGKCLTGLARHYLEPSSPDSEVLPPS